MTFLAVAVAAGLLYWILLPLSGQTAVATAGGETNARLEAALTEILDLEADLDTGKISQSDYETARRTAEKKAAACLAPEDGAKGESK